MGAWVSKPDFDAAIINLEYDLENKFVTTRNLDQALTDLGNLAGRTYAKESTLPSKTLWCGADGSICETPVGKTLNLKGDTFLDGKLTVKNTANFQGNVTIDGDVTFRNMAQFRGEKGAQGETGATGKDGKDGGLLPLTTTLKQTMPVDSTAQQQLYLISDTTGPRFSWGTTLNGKALSVYGHDATGQKELMQLRKEGPRMGTIFTQPITTALPGNSNILRVAEPSGDKVRFILETADNGNVLQVATFDANGNWNNARPFQINADNKVVSMNNGVNMNEWAIRAEGDRLCFLRGDKRIGCFVDSTDSRFVVYTEKGSEAKNVTVNSAQQVGKWDGANWTPNVYFNQKIGIQKPDGGWLTGGGAPRPTDETKWENLWIRQL